MRLSQLIFKMNEIEWYSSSQQGSKAKADCKLIGLNYSVLINNGPHKNRPQQCRITLKKPIYI